MFRGFGLGLERLRSGLRIGGLRGRGVRPCCTKLLGALAHVQAGFRARVA